MTKILNNNYVSKKNSVIQLDLVLRYNFKPFTNLNYFFYYLTVKCFIICRNYKVEMH